MPLEYDLASGSTRELNKKLHALGIGNKIDNICITNPNGAHALAVGLTRSLKVNQRSCRILLRWNESNSRSKH
jgi:hypothetical protein